MAPGIIRFSLDPAFPPKIQIPTGENTNGTQLDPSADAVIINYDKLLNARLANDLCQIRWGAIIPDEAHALKNPREQADHAILWRSQPPEAISQIIGVDRSGLVGDGIARTEPPGGALSPLL